MRFYKEFNGLNKLCVFVDENKISAEEENFSISIDIINYMPAKLHYKRLI